MLMLDNEGMNNPVALKRTELFLFPLNTEKLHRGEIAAFCTDEGSLPAAEQRWKFKGGKIHPKMIFMTCFSC